MSERKNSQANQNDLISLATKYGTDKWNIHWYMGHYETHFGSLKRQKLHLLEVGVGGESDPSKGGESLRVWRDYFPNAKIFGIDIYDKKAVEDDRIKVFQGDQSDAAFLRRVVKEVGGLDIVIDDGSHLNNHVIRTFNVLFPLLNHNGIYVVEDTQASYWPVFGGSSYWLNSRRTTMGYFKRLLDGLNYAEFDRPGYSPTYFDRHIVAVHFYHNLIFIYKGNNDEGSNDIKENNMEIKRWLKSSFSNVAIIMWRMLYEWRRF
jgi:hypothetical protein